MKCSVVVGEEQLCCYRILNALYTLGTRSSTFIQRSEPRFHFIYYICICLRYSTVIRQDTLPPPSLSTYLKYF